MQPGRLIILNGGSSAGKTSLGSALQDLLDDTYLLLGIDVFWLALPPKQLDLKRVDPRFYSWTVEVEHGREHLRIIPGPILDQAMSARYRAIAAFLDRGLNVIADDVIWKVEWLDEALELFASYEVTFIGVTVSDAEGARREAARGNRYPGWSRGSAWCAHQHALYDYVVDTTHEPPQTCALRIKRAFDEGLAPMAFSLLREIRERSQERCAAAACRAAGE